MPFWVYTIEPRSRGESRTYVRDAEVSISGKSGPLYRYVSRMLSKSKVDDLFWEMTEDAVLGELGVERPAESALIVDLKPNVKNNVSLYQLRRIWGISHPEWTPLAVQFETLFVDFESRYPDKFKQRFVHPADRDLVHEFLYVQGGTVSGNWVWGRVGSVNAALLWPDDFKHFVQCIRPYVEANP